MNFKIKKIRPQKQIQFKRIAAATIKKSLKQSKKHLKFKNMMLALSVLIISLFAFFVYQFFVFVQQLSFKDIVFSIFNASLENDKENHSNFLLIGHGGGNHDGANLSDTIMIASLDTNDKTVGIVSIPRDLWVETKELGGTRINKIIELSLDEGYTFEEGIAVLKDAVEQILDIDIHYYASADFAGFTAFIDTIEGIEITVPETIYDPNYPKDGTYDFDPFYIKAGTQNIDGETALKYVRSRKTTSDFDRAKRQQSVLEAIEQKLKSEEILLSKTKLKELYEVFQTYIKTDLEMYEFIYLGRQALQFDNALIAHTVINDDPYSVGGFVYTPERQYFGGAFVLLPYTNTYDEIRKFAKIAFFSPQILVEKTSIHILNGTKAANLASDGLAHLERYGFDVVRFGNSDVKIPETQIYYRSETAGTSQTIKALEEFLGVKSQPAIGSDFSIETFATQAEIVVILGDNFSEYKKANPKLFY